MAQWQDKARVNSYLYTTGAVHYELLFYCAISYTFKKKNALTCVIVRALILNSCLIHGERNQTGEGDGR